MLMPKASMHKDNLSQPRKDDVGFTGKIVAMNAEAITQAMEQGADEDLGLCVLAADLPHVRAAAHGRYCVH